MSTLAVIQCRLGSTRFPNKALADLNGVKLIQHVVGLARQIAGVDQVVLAVPQGQVAALLFASHVVGPPVDEPDVLGRFAWIVEHEYPDADTIVRITGDCPLLQPDLCARLITEWRASRCEYGWIRTDDGTYADGLDCEIFTRDLLMQAHMQATDAYDREHVSSIMRRMRPVFSLPADPAYADWPKCSIDTEEDLERVREFSRRINVA